MNDRPEEFRKLMQASEDKSQKLEKLLNTWKAAGHPEPVPADIKTAFKAVGDACKTCHKDWRD
jgi:cytochrome c556